MEAVISYPQKKEDLQVVKAFLKALKIKFEVTEQTSPYNSEFVAKIKRGDNDILTGNTTKVTLDEIWK